MDSLYVNKMIANEIEFFSSINPVINNWKRTMVLTKRLISVQKKYYLFFILVFLVSYGTVFSHTNSLFNGKWEYVEYAFGTETPHSFLNISLNEGEDGNIYGAYCFVTQHGNKIDCTPDGELNVNGYAIDSSRRASVTFDSFLGAKNGIAELSIDDDDSLTWNIIKRPQGGDYYGPNRISLKRFHLKQMLTSGRGWLSRTKLTYMMNHRT